MSNSQVTVRQGGFNVLGLLGVVFVTLKLLGITAVASWSWWIVTLPFWGVLAIVLGIFLLAGIGVAVAAMLSK